MITLTICQLIVYRTGFFNPYPLALIRRLYRIKYIWTKFFLQLYNPTNKPTEGCSCLKLQ